MGGAKHCPHTCRTRMMCTVAWRMMLSPPICRNTGLPAFITMRNVGLEIL